LDHKDASFGIAYGLLIKELRLLARAIFIIDNYDIIKYIEIVRDISGHPDYTKAFSVAQGLWLGIRKHLL